MKNDLSYSDEGITLKQSDEVEVEQSEIEPEKRVSPSVAIIALTKWQKYFMLHSEVYIYSLKIEKMIKHINIYVRKTVQTSIKFYFK